MVSEEVRGQGHNGHRDGHNGYNASSNANNSTNHNNKSSNFVKRALLVIVGLIYLRFCLQQHQLHDQQHGQQHQSSKEVASTSSRSSRTSRTSRSSLSSTNAEKYGYSTATSIESIESVDSESIIERMEHRDRFEFGGRGGIYQLNKLNHTRLGENGKENELADNLDEVKDSNSNEVNEVEEVDAANTNGIQHTNDSEATNEPHDTSDATEESPSLPSTEPFLNRFQTRFRSSYLQKNTGGYLFHKHIRKAAGTTLRGYFHDVLLYHNVSRSTSDFKMIKHGNYEGLSMLHFNDDDDVSGGSSSGSGGRYHVHYIEQEFTTMDHLCPTIDPRWPHSLRIISLRHPIERHMSEFFFSGPGNKLSIDRSQLYSNETYDEEMAQFLNKYVPKWMRKTPVEEGERGRFEMVFTRQYVDNFQVRALAGCANEECWGEKNVTEWQREHIREFHPVDSGERYSTPKSVCTQFFNPKEGSTSIRLFEICAKTHNVKQACTTGCDGPCFYPAIAWGSLSSTDVDRAISSLKAFDIVLLTETLDEEDQSAFLNDVMGVPRDAPFALNRRDANNYQVKKGGKEEKTHFYRDLLRRLAVEVLEVLEEENGVEIEFWKRAVEVNRGMTERWKKEVGWVDGV